MDESDRMHQELIAEIADLKNRIRALEQEAAGKLVEEERQGHVPCAEKTETIGLLAGGVAHDINNLLGILSGNAEMLILNMSNADPLRDLVKGIVASGEQIAAEVRDLLAITRGGAVLIEPASLNRIVADLLKTSEFSKLLSSHPQVTIETEYKRHLPDINASTIHVERALTNLINNAMHAIPEKGNISIKTDNRYLDRPLIGYEEVPEGEYAVLSVSDTGSGLLPEHLKHIFEPFYLRRVLKHGGTGLGLFVIWSVLKDHGGYIDLASDPGKGTTVTLYFPVKRDVSVRMKKQSASEYMGNRETILVVDDEEEQCRMVARMLMELNYRVETAWSGEEALVYLGNNDADLIVLDMNVETGMDGYDTYRRILEIKKKQKAIILSGFTKTERVQMAQDLGAGEFIMKPYPMVRLGRAVRNELERK